MLGLNGGARYPGFPGLKLFSSRPEIPFRTHRSPVYLILLVGRRGLRLQVGGPPCEKVQYGLRLACAEHAVGAVMKRWLPRADRFIWRRGVGSQAAALRHTRRLEGEWARALLRRLILFV